MSSPDQSAPGGGPDQSAPGGGPDQSAPGPQASGGAEPGAGRPPSEDELRAAYEAELDRIDAIDMIAQAAVSLLNIGARRLAPAPPAAAGGGPAAPGSDPAPGRDLEQAGDAIDGARALLAILERRIPGETAPLRDALSRLQMAYAAEVGTGSPSAAPAPAPAAPTPSPPGQAPPAGGPGASQPQQQGAEQDDPSGPGPAESSGRLWVPGR
jgi:hypothetical protein